MAGPTQPGTIQPGAGDLSQDAATTMQQPSVFYGPGSMAAQRQMQLQQQQPQTMNQNAGSVQAPGRSIQKQRSLRGGRR